MSKYFKLFIIIYLIIKVLDILFSDYLMGISIKLTSSLQLYIDSEYFINFNSFVSRNYFYFFDILFIIFYINSNKDNKILNYYMIFLFSSSFNELEKILYLDYRPNNLYYFEKYNRCTYSFGKPSGHCFIHIIFTLFLIKNFNIKLALVKIILFLSVFFITFNRVYLGYHSINQCIIAVLDGYLFRKVVVYLKNIKFYNIKRHIICLLFILYICFSVFVYIINYKDSKNDIKYCKSKNSFLDISIYLIILNIFTVIIFTYFDRSVYVKNNNIKKILFIFIYSIRYKNKNIIITIISNFVITFLKSLLILKL